MTQEYKRGLLHGAFVTGCVLLGGYVVAVRSRKEISKTVEFTSADLKDIPTTLTPPKYPPAPKTDSAKEWVAQQISRHPACVKHFVECYKSSSQYKPCEDDADIERWLTEYSSQTESDSQVKQKSPSKVNEEEDSCKDMKLPCMGTLKVPLEYEDHEVVLIREQTEFHWIGERGFFDCDIYLSNEVDNTPVKVTEEPLQILRDTGSQITMFPQQFIDKFNLPAYSEYIGPDGDRRTVYSIPFLSFTCHEVEEKAENGLTKTTVCGGFSDVLVHMRNKPGDTPLLGMDILRKMKEYYQNDLRIKVLQKLDVVKLDAVLEAKQLSWWDKLKSWPGFV